MWLGYLSHGPGYTVKPGTRLGTFGTKTHDNTLRNILNVSRTAFAHHLSDGKGAFVLQGGCYDAPSITFILFFTGFNQAKTQKFKPSL